MGEGAEEESASSDKLLLSQDYGERVMNILKNVQAASVLVYYIINFIRTIV
jgi:hypothetical protein